MIGGWRFFIYPVEKAPPLGLRPAARHGQGIRFVTLGMVSREIDNMIIQHNPSTVNTPSTLRVIIDQLLDSEPDPRVRCCRCGQLVRFDFINAITQDEQGNPFATCGACCVYGTPAGEVTQ
jgi:hypothetical protein